jgi:hypothetical protein
MKTMNSEAFEIVVGVCINCTGLGTLAHFSHIESGACFHCGGTGLRLYSPRKYRGELSAIPRGERLDVIRQCLAWYAADGFMKDEFLARNKKRVARFLRDTIRDYAGSLDVAVWDRAYAALGKVCKLDPAKVAVLRASAFPGAAPLNVGVAA